MSLRNAIDALSELSKTELDVFRRTFEAYFREAAAPPRTTRSRNLSPNEAEVAQNYDAFRAQLPALLKEHEGEQALLRHGEIVRFFDTFAEAYRYALSNYEDRLFSIQEVTEARAHFSRPIQLGSE